MDPTRDEEEMTYSFNTFEKEGEYEKQPPSEEENLLDENCVLFGAEAAHVKSKPSLKLDLTKLLSKEKKNSSNGSMIIKEVKDPKWENEIVAATKAKMQNATKDLKRELD